MDTVIIIGVIIFAIGVLIAIGNSRISYGFFTHYGVANQGLAWISVLLIVIGLAIVIGKAYLNGQIG
ncbi:hypothetical protein [uncultured Secundilactobacillus sp.]|uniref:hypothetical protein n=1 Tax=uncultured Secundilactobacillus sp. TaxID=2813935 RepID=UPI00258C9B7B|nr:hypothetical protein [uncultured Secundilactobacillus sp.]